VLSEGQGPFTALMILKLGSKEPNLGWWVCSSLYYEYSAHTRLSLHETTSEMYFRS